MCQNCIQKNDTANLNELGKLLSSVERDVQKLFIQYIARVRSPQIESQILDLLERGRLDEVINILDNQFVGFERLVSDKLSQSAEFEIGIFAATLLGLYAFSYTPTEYRAIQLTQELKNSLILQVIRTQNETMRQVLFDGLTKSTQETARSIVNSVGLTPKQYDAVKNYERLLRTKSNQALTRTLRDTKYDSNIRSHKPLSEAQINRMVDAYRNNMILSRAQTIAQTEAGRIVNEGRRLGILQVLGFMQMPTGNVIKTWRSMNDDRVRFTHSHSGLDGQVVVGMETPFQSPSGSLIRYPHDPQAPSAETINCRCYVLYAYLNQEE